MRVKELVDQLHVEVAAGAKGLEREIHGGYCGDLLSDVMANSSPGDVWLTIQSHQNIVAVAVLRDLAAIILVNGRVPDDETKAKADEEAIPVLCSRLSSFQVACMLDAAGIQAPEG